MENATEIFILDNKIEISLLKTIVKVDFKPSYCTAKIIIIAVLPPKSG